MVGYHECFETHSVPSPFYNPFSHADSNSALRLIQEFEDYAEVTDQQNIHQSYTTYNMATIRSPKPSVSTLPLLDAPLPPITLSDPPRDPALISAQDASLQFPHFTSDDAWALGSLLRSRLLAFTPATEINIALANSQLLFHGVTHPGGVTPDNDVWVSRKRATVLRFGQSTWFMHNKFQGGDERAFAAKYVLGEKAGQYAIHGGGWPVRVKGVEGVVAVVVVSGLKQEQDHQIIVQTVQDYLEGIGAGDAEKRKED